MNKKQTITLAGYFDGPNTIRARIVAPALAVHKTVEPVLGEMPWTITHIPTGYYIARTKTQPQAKRIVGAIKDLADWPNVTQKGPPRMKRDAIRQAIRAIGGKR